LQLCAAVVLLGYTSLGFVPLWQGMYEVDLMNFYVGRLLAGSENPAIALLLGWHPWSLCRGIGYLWIVFEVASISLERMAGVPLSTRRRRATRWALGLGFLVLDGAIKLALLDVVREALAENLR
jgi:hypothetical protein